MPPLLDITVESNVAQAFDAFERELQRELRALASVTGEAVADTARSTVAVATGETRAAIQSVDSLEEIATLVSVNYPADARWPNLDIGIEHGTRFMLAQPFLHPAGRLHAPRYRRQVEEKLRTSVTRVGGRS